MLNYSFSELVLIFIIYAFLGWCIEVIYSTIMSRKFANRGFLNGPYCPVYGFSVIAVIALLFPIKDNLIVYFIGSVILTTLLEFIAGFILEKSFNKKWWDYSKQVINIKGYICLRASVVWGIACVFVAYVLHPLINQLIILMSDGFITVIAGILLAVVLIDTVVSIYSLLKVKQKVQLLYDIGGNIRSLSDAIGKNISDSTIVAMDTNELNSLKQKYESILDKRTIGYNRLARAFPGLDLAISKTLKRKRK